MIDIYGIMKKLPHRYPFLMVDRILEIEPMFKVVGIKNVTINEPYFQGHFPDEPIVPGMLIVESMAQTGGFIFDIDENMAYVVGINNAKFRRKVIPGDVMIVEAKFVTQIGNLGKVKAIVRVDNDIAATAEISYSFIQHG